MGSLPIDKVPSEASRQVLVHALVEEFPEAAKAMATVTRVGKQQVNLILRMTSNAQRIVSARSM
jgi:hypothetical protein